MTIKLAFGRILLDAGKTMAVPEGQRATIRVHDGLVWATSSGNVDDVWLSAGQEHRVPDRGLTVIESTRRATIEIIPAPANDDRAPGPALAWFKAPAWFDDVGALLALVAIVGVMVIAGYQVATAAELSQSIQDAHPVRILEVPASSAA